MGTNSLELRCNEQDFISRRKISRNRQSFRSLACLAESSDLLRVVTMDKEKSRSKSRDKAKTAAATPCPFPCKEHQAEWYRRKVIKNGNNNNNNDSNNNKSASTH